MATEEDIQRLREYVGAPSSTSDDSLAIAWDRASGLVAKFIKDHEADVPAIEVTGSTLEVASELFHRRNAPNGISQFADGQGNPVRVARDPMVAAYKTLSPYIGPGIG